jgi:hypothetical protein
MGSVTYNLWRQFLWVTHDEIVGFQRYTLPLCSSQIFVMRKSSHIASYLVLSTPVLFMWWHIMTSYSPWLVKILVVSRYNRVHVVIFQFFLINVRHIPQIPLKWSVIFLNSWTSTSYCSNSTGSSVTSGWLVVPVHCVYVHFQSEIEADLTWCLCWYWMYNCRSMPKGQQLRLENWKSWRKFMLPGASTTRSLSR